MSPAVGTRFVLRQRETGFYYKGVSGRGALLLTKSRREAHFYATESAAAAGRRSLDNWACLPFAVVVAS